MQDFPWWDSLKAREDLIWASITDWIVSHQDVYGETLAASVTLFRDKACKKAVNVRWGHSVGPQCSITGVFVRGRDPRVRSLFCIHIEPQQGGRHLPIRKTGSHKKPTLILDLEPPELWENEFHCGIPSRVKRFCIECFEDWEGHMTGEHGQWPPADSHQGNRHARSVTARKWILTQPNLEPWNLNESTQISAL